VGVRGGWYLVGPNAETVGQFIFWTDSVPLSLPSLHNAFPYLQGLTRPGRSWQQRR
jgi:hypothetical protein